VVPQDEPERFDVAGESARAANLRESLERAAQRGDIGAAQALSAELQAATARLAHHQQRLIGSQPPPPRGPEEGEEEKLEKQLSSLAARASKLEAKKKKALLAQADELEPDFSDAIACDEELQEVQYEADGLRARQAEIDAFHDNQADTRRRQTAYRRLRIRDAAQKRRREKLMRMVEQIMPQIRDIRDLSRGVGDKEAVEKIMSALR
jgi:hypothetical protein